MNILTKFTIALQNLLAELQLTYAIVINLN